MIQVIVLGSGTALPTQRRAPPGLLIKTSDEGAWLVDPTTLRVQVNHERDDASISEVNLDLVSLQAAISNVINTGETGGVSFVVSARQAYDRWSDNGGSSFTNTSSTSSTSR